MIRIIEINGVLTIRRVSNKLTNAQHADNWIAQRQDIERLRVIKAQKKDRREYMRKLNKQNRMVNARLNKDL